MILHLCNLVLGVIQLLFMHLLEMPRPGVKSMSPKRLGQTAQYPLKMRSPGKKGWHVIFLVFRDLTTDFQRRKSVVNWNTWHCRMRSVDSCRTVWPIWPIRMNDICPMNHPLHKMEFQWTPKNTNYIITKKTTDPGRSSNLSKVYKQWSICTFHCTIHCSRYTPEWSYCHTFWLWAVVVWMFLKTIDLPPKRYNKKALDFGNPSFWDIYPPEV